MPSQEELSILMEHYQNGRFDEAERSARSLALQYPHDNFSWKILGAVLKQTDRKHDAVITGQKAVEINPQDVTAHNNLGNTLKELGKLEEAEASYTQAIALKPDFSEAHNNLGVTLQELGKLEEAEASYRQAIALKPDYAEAHNNLGVTLKKLGKLEEAEASYRQAIALKPDYAKAHNNLGVTLQELGKLEEAEASYRQAITLTTGFVDAHRNLARVLKELGRLEESIESERCTKFLNSSNSEENKSKGLSKNLPFTEPSPIEHPLLYRVGMGTENVGGFLRAMAQMLRPKNILEIGAGYTTPFLLEALVNNKRVYDDGNLEPSYFKNYVYDPKLVVIDNMDQGELRKKPGMSEIISSKYTDFLEGNFEGKAEILRRKYDSFDFVWLDCGGEDEYKHFMDKYWDICSGYIFFHFTHSQGIPNVKHDIILNRMTGNPSVFDIVEPHKNRQGSITMVRKK